MGGGGGVFFCVCNFSKTSEPIICGLDPTKLRSQPVEVKTQIIQWIQRKFANFSTVTFTMILRFCVVITLYNEPILLKCMSLWPHQRTNSLHLGKDLDDIPHTESRMHKSHIFSEFSVFLHSCSALLYIFHGTGVKLKKCHYGESTKWFTLADVWAVRVLSRDCNRIR